MSKQNGKRQKYKYLIEERGGKYLVKDARTGEVFSAHSLFKNAYDEVLGYIEDDKLS